MHVIEAFPLSAWKWSDDRPGSACLAPVRVRGPGMECVLVALM